MITNFGKTLGFGLTVPLLNVPLDLGILIAFPGISILIGMVLEWQARKENNILPPGKPQEPGR